MLLAGPSSSPLDDGLVEPPDTLEKRIRFGCGFTFGAGAAVLWLLFSSWRGYYILAACLALALICGYAAVKLGDRFWHDNPWWLPWWWW